MAKYFLASIGILCLLPLIALAAYDAVQFPEDTNVYLTGLDLTLEIGSGSRVAAMTVNSDNIVFDLEENSNVIVTSYDKRALIADPAIATNVCLTNRSYISLQGTTSQSVTITVGNTCVGGGVGGGGGGGAAPPPPTVTPPTVEQPTAAATEQINAVKTQMVSIIQQLITLITTLIAQLQAQLAAMQT